MLAFVGVCMLLLSGDFARIGTFLPDFYAVFLLEAIMLAWPSRTVHGTLMQLAGLVMPGSAVAILGFCTLEEMGVYFPHWAHMVMQPVVLMFWGGILLYPLVFSCVCLWFRVKMQK